MKILDFMNQPWAILPEKLGEMNEIIKAHLRGEKIDLEGILARTDNLALSGRIKAGSEPNYTVENGAAIIPVSGPLSKQLSLFTFFFGGTTFGEIERNLDAALKDASVKVIILAVDSPGGTVQGTQELAAKIRAARDVKPLAAYTDGMMASAAYWIGAATGKVVISGDTVMTGSIGVVAMHLDWSEYDKKMGVAVTEITAGKYKRIASEHKPLSDEGKAVIQNMVDTIYAAFLGEAAADRKLSVEDHEKYADGRIFIGKQAIEAGLVDGVSTLPRLIGELTDGVSAGPIKTEVKTLIEQEETIMDLKELREKHPDLVKAVFDEGHEAGLKEGEERGKAAGAQAERERIQTVEGQLIPGHEALIQTLKFDGKTTAGEAAIQILAAEKAVIAGKKKDLQSDAQKPALQLSLVDKSKEINKNAPIEERTKSEWDKSPAVRAEFGDYATYLAFVKADEAGQVKIYNRK